MGEWASTGRSRATHKLTVAANTGGGAVLADRCERKGGRGPNNTVSDRLINVSKMNVIM